MNSTTESSRDEKAEVIKDSAKDNLRVMLWRIAVTVVLLLTALAVTITTYTLLKRGEQNNFEVAVCTVQSIIFVVGRHREFFANLKH